MTVHAWGWLKMPIPHEVIKLLALFPGVPIFFVISGFLITRTFLDRDGKLGPYFINRALRIYPALWLNLAIILAAMTAAGVIFRTDDISAWIGIIAATGSTALASVAAGVPLLHWNAIVPFFPGGVLWTIPVEIGFYLLVPLIFLKPLRETRSGAALSIAAWGAASIVLAVWQSTAQSALMDSMVLPYLWIFLLGALATIFWREVAVFLVGRFWLWLTLYLGSSYALYFLGFDGANFKLPTVIVVTQTILLAGCVVSFAFSPHRPGSILRGNDISYGIYLNHFPLVMAFMAAGWTGSTLLLIPMVVVTALVATASWRFIERPALRLKQRIRLKAIALSGNASVRTTAFLRN